MISQKVGGLDPSLSNFGMVKGCLTGTLFVPEHTQLVTTKHDKAFKYKNMADLHRAQLLVEATVEFFKDCEVVYVELPVGSQSA